MLLSSCIALAASTYAVSRSAIQTELSHPVRAAGIGPMHIPRSWMPILTRIGFRKAAIVSDRCTNIEAGAWILAFEHWQKALQVPTLGSSRSLPTEMNAVAQHAAVAPSCIAGAARFYHLPLPLFMAVLKTEGGHVGEIHWNDNGSYDMGPAQINSTWLPTLKKAGITRAAVLHNGCMNVAVGAWILAQAMQGADPHDPAQFWRHVGDYNSHTPGWNARYAVKVWNNLGQ